MSVPAVIFPDLELWATGAIRAALAARGESYAADVFVSNKVPATRRDRMVIVRRDGGPRLDAVRESARLGVNVWGKTDQEATNLARLVAALLWASPDGGPVCKVTQTGGPLAVADESGQPRIYLTFELIVRGSDL